MIPAVVRVERYRLRFASGHSKWASRAVFADGTVVRFMDLAPAYVVRRQAPDHYTRAVAKGGAL